MTKAARVLYGLADQGALPAALGRVHPRRRTPVRATLLAAAVTALLALAFPLEELAVLTSLVTLGAFALADLALVVVKRRDPRPPGIRVWPAWVPAAGFAVSLAFAGFELVRRL